MNSSIKFKTFSAPLFVCWDITYRCNLSCIHCCFEAPTQEQFKKELSTQEGMKMIDELEHLKIISFQFAGGEPFVRKDFINLAEYICNKKISTSIATNGLYIDQYVARKLKKIGIRGVQISLDGSTHSTHEYIRGLNTFDKTIEAIQHLRSEKIPVSVAALLNKHNYDDIIKMITMLHSLNVKTLRVQFLLPQANGKKNKDLIYLDKEELKEKIQELQSHHLVLSKNMNLVMPCFVPSLSSGNSNKLINGSILAGCGAGNTQVNINPYGEVSACGILTDDNWTCGNIRDKSLKEIWQDDEKFGFWRQDLKLEGKCGECSLIKDCGGGCRINAYLKTGNMCGEDPLCWR